MMQHTTFEVIHVPAPETLIGGRETIPRWSDGSRLALGAWTFSMPLIAATLAGLQVWVGADEPPVLLAATFGLFVLHAIITLFYVAYAGQNPRIARTRMAWMIALVLAGPISIPVYWLIHVWNAPRVGLRRIDGVPPGDDRIDIQRRRLVAI